MSLFIRCSVIFALAACFYPRQRAFAQGSLKVNSVLLDSEASKGWTFSPSAEVAVATPVRAGWSAHTQLRLPALKPNDSQAQLSVRVKEAALSMEWEEGTFSAGRLLLRPESTSMNEIVKTFLRSEPSADGMRWAFERDNLRYSLFAGGPWVLGGTLGVTLDKTKFTILYRGERDKMSYFPVVTADGMLTNSPRAAHTQEAELSLKVASKEFDVEGLFQLMDQGLLRRVTQTDAQWGDQVIGSVDTDLPRSVNEYRVAVQGKFRLDQQGENIDSLLLSWASRTAPRLHDGSEEDKFFRQGGGNDSQWNIAVEGANPAFNVQLGTSVEFSSTPKYLYFAKRDDSGGRKFVKSKLQIWTSTRIKF